MTDSTPRPSVSEPVPNGSRPEIISLDSRYNKKGDYEIKLSTSPLVGDGIGSDTWAAYAITSTRFFDQKGKQHKSDLRIRSPQMLQALKSVAPYYPGAPVITEKGVTFESPYKLLFHYFEDLQKYRDNNDDDTIKLHLNLLIRTIRLEVGRGLDELAEVLSAKKITYPLAWAIFRPGTMVFTEFNGAPEQCSVHSSVYSGGDEGGLNIICEQVDFDGKNFKTRKASFKIPEFLGTEEITALSIYPLHFHPKKEDITRFLAERGHKWFTIHMNAPKTMAYAGFARCLYTRGERKFAISGRIVVDNDTFGTINPEADPMARSSLYRYIRSEDNPSVHNNLMRARIDERISDENAAMCTAFVRGYSLNKRLWGTFDVSLMQEVVWSTNSFEKLILRERSKDAIWSLVKSYIDTPAEDLVQDLIQGKGLGMIFLLHGPPGVGKTLTAETIAEHLKRPLYVVSGGELGTTTNSVDEKLSMVLEIATVWKAVVLIDEADVFLQERDLRDLERNSLVAIFLRQLEYYEGLMFLTTNRVDCIDDAFRSRIDVALNYPDLTESIRRKLWKSSLEALDPETLDINLEEVLLLLEKEPMNGREIRKTIKAAKLMASCYNEKITLKHLRTMMDFRMVGSLPEMIEEFGSRPGGCKRQRLE